MKNNHLWGNAGITAFSPEGQKLENVVGEAPSLFGLPL